MSTGWVVDADGRAMHKSAGNYIGAVDAMEKYGADVLRLWVCSVEYTADVRLGVNLLENVGNVYRNFRNRLRWLLGVIEDLTPAALVAPEAMAPFDRLALNATASLAARVVEHYRAYRLHEAYLALVAFDTEDLSRFYVDALKEPLYTEARDSARRRSAQSAAYAILTSLAALLAPVLSFTAEETWQHVPEALRGGCARACSTSRFRAAQSTRRRSPSGRPSRRCARRSRPPATSPAIWPRPRTCAFRARSSTRCGRSATTCARR